MSSSPWLALTDYSSKYKVSMSTLRRRIKAEDIHFRLQDGKYYLIDEPMSAHQKHRPSQDSDIFSMGAQSVPSQIDFGLEAETFELPEKPTFEMRSMFNEKVAGVAKDEPILTAANKLLSELKKAYTQILFEKEEQILQLKEEISDLKTLVKALEGENRKNQIQREMQSSY